MMATLSTYRVVVIPDLDGTRRIFRLAMARNATEAAGMVLCTLGGEPVDCIEVTQGAGPGRKPKSKVVFYCCVYGSAECGFCFEDRLVLAE